MLKNKMDAVDNNSSSALPHAEQGLPAEQAQD